MKTNQEYTEEQIRLCPHLRKHTQMDSPFKEKITINSENEQTPIKKPIETKTESSCPFISKKAEKDEPTQTKETSDDEEEQPQGGCPVMNTNPKKANPGYFIPEIIDSRVYISPFASVLNSGNLFTGKKNKEVTRQWDSYPIFMKHTLMYYGENYDKCRNIEVGYKFFITDELREKGNLCLRRKKFAEALSHYEKAVSVMIWLESDPDEFLLKMKNISKFGLNLPKFTENMNANDIEKFKIQQSENQKQQTEQQNKLIEKNKAYYDEKLNDLLLTSFTDQNVRLCKGPELKEKADQDIYDNILFQLYSNMAVCYMQAKNLKEARQTIQKMREIKENSSIFYIRQAQVLLSDRLASFNNLRKARDGMKKAIELKKSEKVYEHNTNFLKIFSLENHETIFEEMKEFCEVRIREKKKEVNGIVFKILSRTKQIEEAEKSIISRGLVPQEGTERTLLLFGEDEDFEKQVLKRMKKQYQKAIHFFATSESPEDIEQGEIAQRGLAKINELKDKFDLTWNFDFETSCPVFQSLITDVNIEFNIDFKNEKIQKRLKRIQREHARQLIEQFPFDLRLFEHVIQEIFKENKAAEKTGTNENGTVEEEISNELNLNMSKGSPIFLISMLFMAVLLFGLAYLGKSLIGNRGQFGFA